ncbi:hypothetical protein B0A48_18702 [Cryoendolithus antarcticus]|uniref:Uncharacterized protein n=1 Tax=Cryoendolithus antarcticus TaxID=1507870 RepID=A0A1V8S8K5_9PEZI|nr:hypothetical protein B0A48_18702 [Cryoendolithus antarcticus]
MDYPLAHPGEDLSWFGEQAAMERVMHAIETRLNDHAASRGIAWIPRLDFNALDSNTAPRM